MYNPLLALIMTHMAAGLFCEIPYNPPRLIIASRNVTMQTTEQPAKFCFHLLRISSGYLDR